MIIKETKKGNKKYYYLEHSIRKGKKVNKKTIYLGTKVPKNIDKIKTEFLKELKSDLYDKLEKIRKNFQKEWKSTPKNAKKKQIEEISIAFTYNTNAIEGSTITLEEARGIIQDNIAPKKSLYDIKETEAHNKVFFQTITKKEKITEKLILHWHKELFKETKPDLAGKYREYLVRVGHYIAPDWQDVKELMKEMINSTKDKKMNSVELSARIHYKFEKIHPFGDGNGRIGRLIMNQILWHSGYPMLIIEYKKRKSYYNALSKDEEAFVNYYIKRYLATHKRRIK